MIFSICYSDYMPNIFLIFSFEVIYMLVKCYFRITETLIVFGNILIYMLYYIHFLYIYFQMLYYFSLV